MNTWTFHLSHPNRRIYETDAHWSGMITMLGHDLDLGVYQDAPGKPFVLRVTPRNEHLEGADTIAREIDIARTKGTNQLTGLWSIGHGTYDVILTLMRSEPRNDVEPGNPNSWTWLQGMFRRRA